MLSLQQVELHIHSKESCESRNYDPTGTIFVNTGLIQRRDTYLVIVIARKTNPSEAQPRDVRRRRQELLTASQC